MGQTFRDASELLPPHVFESAFGASGVDVNADGRVDLYRANRLYLQEIDGTFTDVFTDLGYEFRDEAFGAIFADADHDGFVETFFMDLGENRPYYVGNQGMRFEEHSNDSGIGSLEAVQGSIWTDFDLDGRLDLFVGLDGNRGRLFRNNGFNFFQDVAATSGFEKNLAYGVAAADFDLDGDPDIMLTQCAAPPNDTLLQNVLYRNTLGKFENASEALGIVDDLPSWGVVWLDYDNDGLSDFYVVNTNHRPTGKPGNSTLYRNLGGAGFEEVTAAAGVDHGAASETIAVAAADFDNDGWVDLFVPDLGNLPPTLYHNNANGTFTDIWPNLGLPFNRSSAVAVADINGDGWIDIFVPATESDLLLLNAGGENHFLTISLRGETSNYFGVGGRIDVYAGGLHQTREITAGDGMTSQSHNLSAHFGLGAETAADSLVVHWPTGAVDRFVDITADRMITIVEGLGVNDPPHPFSLISPLSKSALTSGAETLKFAWTPATDDDDPVLYALHILGPGVDTTIAQISSESAVVERSIFTTALPYRWDVSATDGHSVRAARYGKFVFGPTTASEPMAETPDVDPEITFFPNPVVTTSTLRLVLQAPANVKADVYDALGRRLARLYDGQLGSGDHRFMWAPSNVAPGTYILRVTVESKTLTRILTKR